MSLGLCVSRGVVRIAESALMHGCSLKYFMDFFAGPPEGKGVEFGWAP